MKSDLYAELGVPRGATPEEIKRAYRDQAKERHPDAGGDGASMARLSVAYEVLSDPERRARYDATGDDSMPDDLESAARELFAAACSSCLIERKVNVRDWIKSARAGWESEKDAKLRACKEKSDEVEAAETRIIKRPQEDLIGVLLAQIRTALVHELAAINREWAIRKRALELFEGYQFEEPEPSMNVFAPFYYEPSQAPETMVGA